jgi:hypothetical protein
MVPTQPDAEELPRVTVSLLRRADRMCPRRLAHEHASSRKPSPLGDAAFEVSSRLVEDAILWHQAGVDIADVNVAFPDPHELAPEQQALYRALARGYHTTFRHTEGDVDDLGWSTDIPELSVRLVGRVGIALNLPNGDHELRVVRVAHRDLLLDDIDIRFTLLRAQAWAPDGFRIIALDPLDLQSVEYEIDTAGRLDESLAWLAERVEHITARADRTRAVAGADCRDCSCIPGCPQITVAS